MNKVLADNNLRQYRAKFSPPRNFIAPSTYSHYTPEEEEDDGNYYDDNFSRRHSNEPPEPMPKPDTVRNYRQEDISNGIDVSNAEEQQPVETQIDDDFFE